MPLAGLARGAAVNLVARFGAVALGLAILVVVARLGPEVQGTFSLFVAVEALLLTLFSGFGLALARRVSHHRESGAGTLHAALVAAVAVGLVASAALALVAALSVREPYKWLGLLAMVAPLLMLVPTASGLWLGQGRMLPLNAAQVAAPALVLIGLVAMMQGSGVLSIGSVLLVWVAGKAVVGAVTALAALRAAPRQPPAWAALRADAGFIAVIGLTNVVSLLNYRVTLFLIERAQGLAAVGVYSVAMQVAELLWLLSSAITVSAYHRIGAPEREVAALTALRASRINVLATAAAAPLLLAVAWWALPALLGPDYAAALAPLALLLPGIAAYAAASSLSAFFTNHLGRPQWAGAIAALSLALNTMASLWAVPRYGAIGAAVSTSLSYSVAIVVALALFLRETAMPWRALWRR